MTKTYHEPLAVVYKTLIIILFIVIGILLVGTFYGIIRSKSNIQPINLTQNKKDESSSISYFSGIGRIRATTHAPEPATVIVTIVFPYNKEDTPFVEELIQHIADFRQITIDFFSSYTAKELQSFTEEKIKQKLLAQYNDLFRLGKIHDLYFNEYFIIE